MDQQLPGEIIRPSSAPTVEQPAVTQPYTQPQPEHIQPAPHQPYNNSQPTPDEFAAQYSPEPLKKAGKIPKKKLSFILIAIAAVALIGGSSAAAYFGVVVPNKPENKLLSALSDLAGQKELVTEGTVDVKSTDGIAVALNYKAETNLEKNQLGIAGTVGFSGTQFPYEIRYVDKNIYAKVGGLDGLSKINNSKANDFLSYAKTLTSINDKWYVVDRSYLQAVGDEASCATDISFVLTKDDISMLKSAYQKHPLFKVKSTSAVKVGNDETTKYDVEPASDPEAVAFAKELNGLSVVKKVNDCLKTGGSNNTIDKKVESAGKAETANGTMAFYISKDKKIKKLELETKDKGSTVKITAGFTYKQVSVAAPEGAKPIQELLGGLFGGGLDDLSSPGSTAALTPSAPASTNSNDVERETDIKALHGQVEAYYAQNGYYPTLANMNTNSFRATYMKGLDNEAFKDPGGSAYTLVVAPQKNIYAYAVSPSGCTNSAAKTCDSYILTATLSNGTAYAKVSLNQ